MLCVRSLPRAFSALIETFLSDLATNGQETRSGCRLSFFGPGDFVFLGKLPPPLDGASFEKTNIRRGDKVPGFGNKSTFFLFRCEKFRIT